MNNSLASRYFCNVDDFCRLFLKLDFSQPEAIIAQLLLCSVWQLHGNYVNKVCTSKPVNKGKLDNSIIERVKVQAVNCLLSLHFLDSTILVTSFSTDQKGKQPKSVMKGLPE